MAEDIDVSEVSYEYQVTGRNRVLAVRDVSFSVPATRFLCILGPSGCGKTTILNMLAGFLTPTRGDIRIGGRPLNGRQQELELWRDVEERDLYAITARSLEPD